MIPFSQEIIDTGAVLAALVTAAGAGWSGWKYVLVPIKNQCQNVSNAVAIVNRELSNNGGLSIKDRIERIELRILINEARVRASMQLQYVAHWESNTKGECVYASPELCELTGKTQEQIMGYGWVGMISEPFRDRVRHVWDECVRDKREFDMQYEYTHPDGHSIPVRGMTTTIRNSRGEFMGMIGVSIPAGDFRTTKAGVTANEGAKQ